MRKRAMMLQHVNRSERQVRAYVPMNSASRLLPHLAADWSLCVMVVMVGAAIGLHAYHLGHNYIGSWDEAFHAVVALHLAQHPLQPTLYDIAALTPPTSLNWNNTHIWMHIPPFGM